MHEPRQDSFQQAFLTETLSPSCKLQLAHLPHYHMHDQLQDELPWLQGVKHHSTTNVTSQG